MRRSQYRVVLSVIFSLFFLRMFIATIASSMTPVTLPGTPTSVTPAANRIRAVGTSEPIKKEEQDIAKLKSPFLKQKPLIKFKQQDNSNKQQNKLPELAPSAEKTRVPGFNDKLGSDCISYDQYSRQLNQPLSAGKLQLPYQRPPIECRTFYSPYLEKKLRIYKREQKTLI